MLPISYQLPLVVLSFIVATLASYVALDVAGRIVPGDRGGARWLWVIIAGAALGGGIWSMHFIAMLALQLPVAVWYQVPQVVVSALVAVLAAAVALGIATGSQGVRQVRMIPSAIAMGGAVAGMHYIGMAAMRGPFFIQYNMRYVWISVAIAVVASYAALWLMATAPVGLEGAALTGRRCIAAIVMGIAVSGMHYTGMYAAGFCGISSRFLDSAGSLETSVLAVSIALMTVVLLAIGLAAAAVDRLGKLEGISSRTSQSS